MEELILFMQYILYESEKDWLKPGLTKSDKIIIIRCLAI